jgi:15-cis-phytoene synthase
VHLPSDTAVTRLVSGWLDVGRAADSAPTEAARTAGSGRMSRPPGRRSGHARTLLPREQPLILVRRDAVPAEFRRRVESIYAFCRVTDDLADEEDGATPAQRLERLDRWERLARTAYDGGEPGVPLLTDVMADAARSAVPFRYIEELIEGMRMDVRNERYDDVRDLRRYSYRVAGVVGQWLTRACGVHDPATLERAAALGHAMQLTNILRDVGEDARRGRLYLPQSLLVEYGISGEQLLAAAQSADVAAEAVPKLAYASLLERLMADADRDYALALDAVPRLPPAFRRAVVAAAHVYRGIHDQIRANGYDNIRRRAQTSLPTRLRLGLRALLPGGADLTPAPAGARRRRAWATTLLALVLVASAAPVMAQQARPPAEHARELEARLSAGPFEPALGMDLARALYFRAVDDAGAVDTGRAALDRLRAEAPDFARAHAPLVLAYDGAFSMLDARHGRWPHARLRAVRTGLARLDAAVAQAPDNLEIRYLRLVSTHYLPSFFGRRDTAREDLRVAAVLVRHDQRDVPPAVRAVIESFIAEAGLT